MYIAYIMSHMWVIEAFFKKWLIAHYSRMKPKFKNPKPYNVTLSYADFIFEDQNQRQWPSSEKLSPTFFGTSNFETWLSRDPITWHPEVRFLGYKMTHFITLSPQKNFSRTLQILGSIAEPCHSYKAHIPNIHALNSATHTLRIQYEYTQKQCMGVAIESMDIW